MTWSEWVRKFVAVLQMVTLFFEKIEKTLDLQLTPRSKITLNIEAAEHLADNRSADSALEGRK
jgi:hypothetical protein